MPSCSFLLSCLLTLTPAMAAEVDPSERPDLLEIAAGSEQFTTLTAAVKAAGLEEALQGEGPLTVFAPTDDAFARLPAGVLEELLRPERRADLLAVLTYHVVPGRVTGVQALQVDAADSLQGAPLAFELKAGVLRVNESAVTANDIEARNGLIHVIDRVLLPPASQPSSPATDLVSLAIDRGVPLFNAGQTAACAAVYEVACRALLELDADLLPQDVAGRVSRALGEAAGLPSASDRAWALRGALDAVLANADRLPAAQPTSRRRSTTPARLTTGERVLFDFDPAATPWPSVNDNVMGGVSRGRCKLTGEGTAVFMGALSLDNNGGFSTIRSPAADLALDGAEGLLMRVRGDGRSYTASVLPNDEPRELHYWQTGFETRPDEWIEVRVPFAGLTHRVMGWVVNDGPLDPGSIRSLALGISDKDVTPFALEIDWIKAYGEGARE